MHIPLKKTRDGLAKRETTSSEILGLALAYVLRFCPHY
jgi:hypothetical protein